MSYKRSIVFGLIFLIPYFISSSPVTPPYRVQERPPCLRDSSCDFDNIKGRTFNLLDEGSIDSFIVQQMNSNHIPGLSACVIKCGQIIWTGAYGYANIGQNIEVQDSTIFMLASISKTLTGTALLQIYEEGLFSLDEDINTYLPFHVVNPQYPDSAITFRMLLTHTSSIRDNWITLALLTTQGDSPIQLDNFLSNYLVPGGIYYSSANNFHSWPPGTDYDYCNVGVTLIGYLVESIADTPFNQYCGLNIFEPLSMSETSWFLADLDTSKIAMPYHWNGSNYTSYGHWGNPIYPSFQLRTSSLQLAHFLIAIMQNGKIDSISILDSSTVQLMTTVQYPDIASGQGLIWKKINLNGRWLWGHGGFTAGVKTEMWFCQDESTGVIVLTNGESEIMQIVEELFEFAAEYTGIAERRDDFPSREDIILYSVCPNPFNSLTTVYFNLNTPTDVTLNVYNIAGQEVASLINEGLSPGEHKITFSANDLLPGVYYFHLKTDLYSITRKILLVR